MESSQLPEVLRRTDVISYALLAEINHFHSERTIDFKLAMQNYLREQTVFYQKVCKLCSAFYVQCCQGILGCSFGGGCQTAPNDAPAFLQKAPEADYCRLEQPAYRSSQFHEVWNYRCTILVPWFLALTRHVCMCVYWVSNSYNFIVMCNCDFTRIIRNCLKQLYFAVNQAAHLYLQQSIIFVSNTVYRHA